MCVCVCNEANKQQPHQQSQTKNHKPSLSLVPTAGTFPCGAVPCTAARGTGGSQPGRVDVMVLPRLPGGGLVATLPHSDGASAGETERRRTLPTNPQALPTNQQGQLVPVPLQVEKRAVAGTSERCLEQLRWAHPGWQTKYSRKLCSLSRSCRTQVDMVCWVRV